MPEVAAEKAYQEITAPEYGSLVATTFVLQEAGRAGSLLSGPCPRCGHRCDVPVVDNVFKGLPGMPGLPWGNRRRPAEDRIEPMVCECGGEHPGRPTGRTGCGAYWTLVIKNGSR
ncbi:hypothetical protein ACWD5F_37235 [Streptomyces sp. NPDC002499]